MQNRLPLWPLGLLLFAILSLGSAWFMQKAPVGPVQNGVRITSDQYVAVLVGCAFVSWMLAALVLRRNRRPRFDSEEYS